MAIRILYKMDKSYLIAGASHVELWRTLVNTESILPLSKQDLIYGKDAIPIFSFEIKEFIEKNEKKVDHIILFVSDFRFGNLYLKNHKYFQNLFINGSEFEENFIKTQNYGPPKKELISQENDNLLYKNALDILDYYKDKYQDKITFLFWDLNVREARNIENRKYFKDGKYKHPVWNYDDLHTRYKNNTYDIRVFRSNFEHYLIDQQGHPNFRAYCFLWHLFNLKDSKLAYEVTEKQYKESLKTAFHSDNKSSTSHALSSKYSKVTFPLNVFALITKLDTGKYRELHYGLYMNKNDTFIQAQKNSTDIIFNHLYKSPAKLLEVGIGFGKTHQKLLDKGFNCTGISPDQVQIDIVNNKLKDTNLVCTKYEDFELNTKETLYDIILFQESVQYIQPEVIFSRANKFLKTGGKILIIDEFSRNELLLHDINIFKNIAKKNNFNLLIETDFSAHASPTVDYILDGLDKYSDDICNQLNYPVQKIYALTQSLQKYKEKYKNKQYSYVFFLFEKT